MHPHPPLHRHTLTCTCTYNTPSCTPLHKNKCTHTHTWTARDSAPTIPPCLSTADVWMASLPALIHYRGRGAGMGRDARAPGSKTGPHPCPHPRPQCYPAARQLGAAPVAIVASAAAATAAAAAAAPAAQIPAAGSRWACPPGPPKQPAQAHR